MTECDALAIKHYSYGALHSGIQKNAVQNLKAADVIVLGNSRTRGGFSTDAIEDYFSQKGLKYFVLVEDGVGVRTPTIMVNKLELSPKTLLLNNENFQYTGSGIGFDEMLENTRKSKTEFRAFYFAQTLQSKICSKSEGVFHNWMCKGEVNSNWRSAINGHIPWDKIGNPATERLVVPKNETHTPTLGEAVNKGKKFISNNFFEDTCSILYQVNTPASKPMLLKNTARELELQFSYISIDDLYSYDGSHLDRPNSEKWAQAIIPLLDTQIDNCIAGDGRMAKPIFNPSDEEHQGVSDYETWVPKLGASVVDQAIPAPIGVEESDIIKFTKRAGRIQKLYKNKSIKAGESLTFTGALWSPDYANIRVQIIRNCSSTNPMESTGKPFTLTPDPQTISITHTFKHDQDCAMIQIMGVSENVSVGAWNYNVTHKPLK